jgi:hypothetical protein
LNRLQQKNIQPSQRKLKEFFSPLADSFSLAGIRPIAGPSFVTRSTGDKEKVVTAKIDQAKFALYNIGGI